MSRSCTPPGRNHSPSPSASSSGDHQGSDSQLSPPTAVEAKHTLPGDESVRGDGHLAVEESSSLTCPREAVQPDVPYQGPGSPSTAPHSRATSARRTESDHGTSVELPSAPMPDTTSKRRLNTFGRTTFGLKPKHGSGNNAGFVDPRDYENKYPEDPMYEELSENARVWRVYLDEAADFDADIVEKASDGLDLLLVFAGLFSAVLTTFVAQTSQSLSNNYAAVSASLLTELVLVQRALANGTSVTSIPPSDITSGPSQTDVWVNALWFISLTLSLSTALLAVLVRQWLHQYTAITSGTSRDRSLVRQYRYDGLMKWHVPVIISLLPVLLHAALGLFLAGLVIFLIPLNLTLAWTVASITCLVYAIYTISNLLPLVDPQCPYRTPFSDILHKFWLSSLISLSIGHNFIQDIVRRYSIKLKLDKFWRLQPRPETPSIFNSDSTTQAQWLSLKEIEGRKSNTEEVGVEAIEWLLHSTANPPTARIALQSFGGFSQKMYQRLPGLVASETRKAVAAEMIQATRLDTSQDLSSQARCIERLSRSMFSISCPLDPSRASFHRSLWLSSIDGSDIPSSMMFSLLPMDVINKMNYVQPWQIPRIRDLFLYILDPSTDQFLLPLHLWRGLLRYNLVVKYFPVLSSSLADSPDTLLRLYRLAFALPSPSRGRGAFQVELTPAPKDSMQRLAIDMALGTRHISGNGVPTPEKTLQALCIIVSNLWDSVPNPSTPSEEESGPVVGAWSIIATRCQNVDISSSLSQDLAKAAVSILKALLPHASYRYTHVLQPVITAVRTVGGDVASRTYAEFFHGQDSSSDTQFELFRGVFTRKNSDIGSRFWADALEANAPQAYTYFTTLDILQLDDREAIHQRTPSLSIPLPAFINGLARRSLPPAVFDACCAYLFQPDHLFAACAGFGAVTMMHCPNIHYKGIRAMSLSILRKTIEILVNLDPKHPSWAERTTYVAKYVDPSISCRTDDGILAVFRLIDELLEVPKVISLTS
ncbi:hypothetical protein HGRIS_014542 [Hohenbuehelia grisea]|uniref:DUF6535 domain-containing protein n=1 Tax=Hohenbuehelia grisea TaxID=104357 RepID=A0ABR3JUM7_9AGAR